MYPSLKQWVNIPVTIKPCIRRNGVGAKVFGEPIETFCYPEGDAKAIRNALGIEVTSTRQLHFDGQVKIGINDEVVFENETLTIQAINTYYRDGQADVKVVYL